MNEQFQEFFTGLAQRVRSENNLSDFTYVALEAIPEFKRDFVHFFLPRLEMGDDEIEVIREFTLESTDEQPVGRPDFLLRCNAWDLIVENKILDRNFSKESGSPSITIDIHKSRNPNHFLAINQIKSSPVFEKKYWPDNGLIQLRMPKQKFNEINIESAKEKQIESLKAYLKNCCNALIKKC